MGEMGRTEQTATAVALCSASAAWSGLWGEKQQPLNIRAKQHYGRQIINCYKMIVNYFHCALYSVNESPLLVSWSHYRGGEQCSAAAPRLQGAARAPGWFPWGGWAVFTANTVKDSLCWTLPGLFPWVDPRPLLCFMQIVMSSCYSGAALENSPEVWGHAVLPGLGLGSARWMLGVALGQ